MASTIISPAPPAGNPPDLPIVHPQSHQITRVALGGLSATLFCSAGTEPSQVEVDELVDLLKVQSLIDRKRREQERNSR